MYVFISNLKIDFSLNSLDCSKIKLICHIVWLKDLIMNEKCLS